VLAVAFQTNHGRGFQLIESTTAAPATNVIPMTACLLTVRFFGA